MPSYGDKLRKCDKMRCGLPTLDWSRPDLERDALFATTPQWVEYSHRCEELHAMRLPPEGPLRDDKWEMGEDTEHLLRSWEVGLTPYNLYAFLLVQYCEGRLEKCHLTKLSLKDPRLPITIIAHRIHGIWVLVGVRCRVPFAHQPVQRLFEDVRSRVQAAKYARGSFDGAVFIHNIHRTLPWVMEHLGLLFAGPVVELLREQLREVQADISLMVERSTMDPYTLLNFLNRTQSGIVWKRLQGYGDLAGLMARIAKARRAADHCGTDLNGVVPRASFLARDSVASSIPSSRTACR